MHGRINPVQKIVGGIVGATYVSRVCCAVDRSQHGVNSLENVVGGFVLTSSLSPCIDDTLVVAEKLEMNVGGASVEESEDEKLEADALGPANVMPSVAPAWV